MAPRFTDEDKKARGTFQSNRGAEAMARQKVSKVLQFPVLREMPESSFPLGESGRKTFEFWARKLLEAGLLTEVTLRQVEGLAVADQKIADRLAKGREVSDATIETRRKVLHYLEGLNVDTSFFANQTKKSAFASNGFPNRLRTPAEHRASVAG